MQDPRDNLMLFKAMDDSESLSATAGDRNAMWNDGSVQTVPWNHT